MGTPVAHTQGGATSNQAQDKSQFTSPLQAGGRGVVGGGNEGISCLRGKKRCNLEVESCFIWRKFLGLQAWETPSQLTPRELLPGEAWWRARLYSFATEGR